MPYRKIKVTCIGIEDKSCSWLRGYNFEKNLYEVHDTDSLVSEVSLLKFISSVKVSNMTRHLYKPNEMGYRIY